MEELHDHPNILKSIRLLRKRRSTAQCKGFDVANQEFDVHLTTAPFHLIEYWENGNFLSYLKNQDALPENMVTFYAEQLLGCMEYVHYMGYAHMDVKLDNILLDNGFKIKLSDFGSAVKIGDQPTIGFRRGTPKYMAPEVFDLKKGETFDAYKADIYSMGVWIYLMLFKRFPVHETGPYPATKDLLENPSLWKTCPFDCGADQWESLSTEIKCILIACLNRDSKERPTSSELISHFYLPTFDENIDEDVFSEMQTRRAKYEQDRHEKQLQQKEFAQPDVPGKLQCDMMWPQEIHHDNPHYHKSGNSTYASTNSKN